MKLAEALMLRADQQKRLASLRERVGQNAVVQEGDQPYEDPSKLIEEAFSVLREWEALVCRVNRANFDNRLPDGQTLAEAISHRAVLVARHSLLQHAIACTRREPDRYSMREIKWVAAVDVAGLQRQSEDLAQQIRQLNAAIQEANWRAELGG